MGGLWSRHRPRDGSDLLDGSGHLLLYRPLGLFRHLLCSGQGRGLEGSFNRKISQLLSICLTLQLAINTLWNLERVAQSGRILLICTARAGRRLGLGYGSNFARFFLSLEFGSIIVSYTSCTFHHMALDQSLRYLFSDGYHLSLYCNLFKRLFECSLGYARGFDPQPYSQPSGRWRALRTNMGICRWRDRTWPTWRTPLRRWSARCWECPRSRPLRSPLQEKRMEGDRRDGKTGRSELVYGFLAGAQVAKAQWYWCMRFWKWVVPGGPVRWLVRFAWECATYKLQLLLSYWLPGRLTTPIITTSFSLCCV